MTTYAITLFFFSFAITGVNVTTASIFEAKHSVGFSMIISILRAFGLLLPVLWFFSRMPNPNMLWLAVPVAEVLTLPVSLFLWNLDVKSTKEISSEVVKKAPEQVESKKEKSKIKENAKSRI